MDRLRGFLPQWLVMLLLSAGVASLLGMVFRYSVKPPVEAAAQPAATSQAIHGDCPTFSAVLDSQAHTFLPKNEPAPLLPAPELLKLSLPIECDRSVLAAAFPGETGAPEPGGQRRAATGSADAPRCCPRRASFRRRCRSRPRRPRCCVPRKPRGASNLRRQPIRLMNRFVTASTWPIAAPAMRRGRVHRRAAAGGPRAGCRKRHARP